MDLEFIEGFDAVSPGKEGEKYAPYVQSGPFLGPFEQTAILPGRFSGGCLQIINTAFGEYLKIKRLPLTTKKIFGCAIHHSAPFGGGFVRSLWLRFQIGNLPQMCIQTSLTGMLQLVRGVNVNTASTGIVTDVYGPLDPSRWYYFEMAVDFASPGTVFIWIDGSLVYGDTNINTTPNGNGCDAVTRRWQNFGTTGMLWDDCYAGSGSLQHLGPSRVLTVLPTADYRALWTPSAAGDHFPLVNETNASVGGAPDDDATYVQSAGLGDDLYGLRSVDCLGRIWGIALNGAAKITSFSQGITLVARDGLGRTVNFGGLQQPDTLAVYKVLQGVSEQDNDSNAWNPRLMDACAFGVSSGGLGERISQVYLEALTSLDPAIPFECGAHSYAY